MSKFFVELRSQIKVEAKRFIAVLLAVLMIVAVPYPVHANQTPAGLAGKKVEIAFLIDASGSMSPYIEKVKENVAKLAESLESQGVDLRMAAQKHCRW